jgi:hypothetical protein
MVSTHPNIWKWLTAFAVGLMLLGAFGPLPDPWDRIAIGVGAALQLVYIGLDEWEKRRQRQADQSSSAAISSNNQM